jgi:hypothetical protein
MAFCNSCGATLNPGTNFCSKCGSANASVPGAAPTPAARPVTAPPPSSGSSSALKIILIIVGVIVLLGILGVATVGFIGYRIAKNSHVNQKGDNVKVETPFGNMETSTDPAKTAEELGVEVYPGAEPQKNGTASVTFGSLHTITAVFDSSDSVDKVCDFYRTKFPNATVSSSDQNQCSIFSGDKGNSMTITVLSRADGSRFTIVKLTKNP